MGNIIAGPLSHTQPAVRLTTTGQDDNNLLNNLDGKISSVAVTYRFRNGAY